LLATPSDASVIVLSHVLSLVAKLGGVSVRHFADKKYEEEMRGLLTTLSTESKKAIRTLAAELLALFEAHLWGDMPILLSQLKMVRLSVILLS
jgi:hypothetical protein